MQKIIFLLLILISSVSFSQTKFAADSISVYKNLATANETLAMRLMEANQNLKNEILVKATELEKKIALVWILVLVFIVSHVFRSLFPFRVSR